MPHQDQGSKQIHKKIFLKQLEEFGKMIEAYRVEMKVLKENAIYENEAEELIRSAEEMGQIGGIFQFA